MRTGHINNESKKWLVSRVDVKIDTINLDTVLYDFTRLLSEKEEIEFIKVYFDYEAGADSQFNQILKKHHSKLKVIITEAAGRLLSDKNSDESIIIRQQLIDNLVKNTFDRIELRASYKFVENISPQAIHLQRVLRHVTNPFSPIYTRSSPFDLDVSTLIISIRNCETWEDVSNLKLDQFNYFLSAWLKLSKFYENETMSLYKQRENAAVMDLENALKSYFQRYPHNLDIDNLIQIVETASETISKLKRNDLFRILLKSIKAKSRSVPKWTINIGHENGNCLLLQTCRSWLAPGVRLGQNRLKYGISSINMILPTMLSGSKVLEIGAGDGVISERIKLSYDCAMYALDDCRNGDHHYDALLSRLGNDFVEKCSVQNALEIKPEKYFQAFDVVCCFKYSVPLMERRGFFEAISKVVKPGGSVYLTFTDQAFCYPCDGSEHRYINDDALAFFDTLNLQERDSIHGADILMTLTDPKPCSPYPISSGI